MQVIKRQWYNLCECCGTHDRLYPMFYISTTLKNGVPEWKIKVDMLDNSFYLDSAFFKDANLDSIKEYLENKYPIDIKKLDKVIEDHTKMIEYIQSKSKKENEDNQKNIGFFQSEIDSIIRIKETLANSEVVKNANQSS